MINPIIKAVIFDLDGTLIDSLPHHIQSFITLFKKFGSKTTKKQVHKYLRLPTEEMYFKLNTRKKLGLELEKFLEIRRKLFYQSIRGKHLLYPDVQSLLRKMNGYKLGIATNSSRVTLDNSTNKRFLKKFNATITYTDVLHAKPDPEMLEKIAKKMHVHPSECIFIGDSVMDVRAAKRAGMISVGLIRKTGASTKTALKKEKPDYLIESLLEIRKIV